MSSSPTNALTWVNLTEDEYVSFFEDVKRIDWTWETCSVTLRYEDDSTSVQSLWQTSQTSFITFRIWSSRYFIWCSWAALIINNDIWNHSRRHARFSCDGTMEMFYHCGKKPNTWLTLKHLICFLYKENRQTMHAGKFANHISLEA